jgi:malto-oligosyltrehalose synthase/4-alpha-glucanotransferase
MTRADLLHPQLFDPIATYRVQFHKGFTFTDFERLIPYFHKLGVRTIYASPIFEAVPGSMHGYDITDPTKINPELGTLGQLREIRAQLKKIGISWLQDIVPNHMAFHPQNKWLMDVLEKGQDSEFASFFDIQWEHEQYNGKVMLPILDTTLEEAISNNHATIVHENGSHFLKYYDNLFPLKSSAEIDMPQGDEALKAFNAGNEQVASILAQQHYALCHWRSTEQSINYRRFFTVSGLIGVNIQEEKVFNAYHTLIKQLLDEGIFQGLRVDHIDGLQNPMEYLYRLREMAGDNVYIAIEKILQPDESLPVDFPVQGTTGYDFLGVANNLFINGKSKKLFGRFYRQKVKPKIAAEEAYEKKRFILYRYMNGELENLCAFFRQLSLAEGYTVNGEQIKQAIGAFLIYCPVYRYYGDRMPLQKSDAEAVQRIFDTIRVREQGIEEAVGLLETVLLKRPLANDIAYNERALQFYQRCMQFTGPLMAKGVEDTLMYTYNQFIGQNDVGDLPGAFGGEVAAFHKSMLQRQRQWNYTMNTTATHDAKRGEDARARLNVLSDIGADWTMAVREWMQMNSAIKVNGAPHVNDEYFIYQALIGSFPMPGQSDEGFRERFQAYIQKALREAKMRTDWATPNEAYEQAVASFINKLLDENGPFYQRLQQMLLQVVDAGIINSLSQVLLKFTCPGVPDIYQGGELWDLNMVDPDNRRQVDYGQRTSIAEANEAAVDGDGYTQRLWEERYDGRIKLWLIQKLLVERNAEVALFSKGYYQPLQVRGKHRQHVVAFARWYQHTWYVVVVPRFISSLAKQQQRSVTEIDWGNTYITLPENIPVDGRHLLMPGLPQHHRLNVSDVFEGLPLAILKYKAVPNQRGAGILMPVFSLPSPFGIGDYGKGAMAFADFLYQCKQKYWQILPINPTTKENGYSPYSSLSSMAGNPMLISPEGLADIGLLDESDLKNYHFSTENVDYVSAEKIKTEVCGQAYENFIGGDFVSLKYQFKSFCKQHHHWLDDYALFQSLKAHFNNKPWYDWPEAYKKRDKQTLEAFAKENTETIEKTKWLQFIITIQWNKLRSYCNSLGIQLFGDLAFYVAHDSVAAWRHTEIFSIDEEGKMTGIAGVPPDYFSSDGQLWNMPTYNWHALKADNYKWWIHRLERNMQMFDLLRLDHFRAFAEYWEVPAGELTAKNGKWLPGPGIEFFNELKEKMHSLPFIAEDLGSDMERVYELRNKIGMPGMKVLQFAWGVNMPVSVDAPHNYTTNCIVYTGTHDNNTAVGWYKEETTKADHERISQYSGGKITYRTINKVLVRLAYASVAETAIVPMQDILGLGSQARMNVPGSEENNWKWRLPADALSGKAAKWLRDFIVMFNRG